MAVRNNDSRAGRRVPERVTPPSRLERAVRAVWLWVFAAGLVVAVGVGAVLDRGRLAALIGIAWLLTLALLAVGAFVGELRGRRLLIATRLRVCPRCAYMLVGLRDAGTCPECGYEYTRRGLREIWRAFINRDPPPTINQ